MRGRPEERTRSAHEITTSVRRIEEGLHAQGRRPAGIAGRIAADRPSMRQRLADALDRARVVLGRLPDSHPAQAAVALHELRLTRFDADEKDPATGTSTPSTLPRDRATGGSEPPPGVSKPERKVGGAR